METAESELEERRNAEVLWNKHCVCVCFFFSLFWLLILSNIVGKIVRTSFSPRAFFSFWASGPSKQICKMWFALNLWVVNCSIEGWQKLGCDLHESALCPYWLHGQKHIQHHQPHRWGKEFCLLPRSGWNGCTGRTRHCCYSSQDCPENTVDRVVQLLVNMDT